MNDTTLNIGFNVLGGHSVPQAPRPNSNRTGIRNGCHKAINDTTLNIGFNVLGGLAAPQTPHPDPLLC